MNGKEIKYKGRIKWIRNIFSRLYIQSKILAQHYFKEFCCIISTEELSLSEANSSSANKSFIALFTKAMSLITIYSEMKPIKTMNIFIEQSF